MAGEVVSPEGKAWEVHELELVHERLRTPAARRHGDIGDIEILIDILILIAIAIVIAIAIEIAIEFDYNI